MDAMTEFRRLVLALLDEHVKASSGSPNRYAGACLELEAWAERQEQRTGELRSELDRERAYLRGQLEANTAATQRVYGELRRLLGIRDDEGLIDGAMRVLGRV